MNRSGRSKRYLFHPQRQISCTLIKLHLEIAIKTVIERSKEETEKEIRQQAQMELTREAAHPTVS